MPFDVKQWLAEKTAELGLDQNEQAAAAKLLTNPKFQSDFVPTPVFHSTIDKVKNKYEAELGEALDYNEQWREKYEKEWKPKLDAVSRLEQEGFNVSGLSNDGKGGVRDRSGNNFTQEQIDELLNSRIEPVRAVAIDYATFITEKGVEYSTTYNKPFKASEFRKFTFENRDKYPTLESAFDAFTAADKQAKEEKDREDWKKAESDRIRLEVASSMNLPEAVAFGNAGDSPAFLANDQKDEVTRDQNRQNFAKQFADLKITL